MANAWNTWKASTCPCWCSEVEATPSATWPAAGPTRRRWPWTAPSPTSCPTTITSSTLVPTSSCTSARPTWQTRTPTNTWRRSSSACLKTCACYLMRQACRCRRSRRTLPTLTAETRTRRTLTNASPVRSSSICVVFFFSVSNASRQSGLWLNSLLVVSDVRCSPGPRQEDSVWWGVFRLGGWGRGAGRGPQEFR